MGVTDPDGDAVTITVTNVTQDEPVNAKGDGSTSPDAVIEAGAASVRAERSGKGNGRVYEVSFKAEDGKGGSCIGKVTVGVPHSMQVGLTAIDDGQLYDSTVR
jgi:chitinase